MNTTTEFRELLNQLYETAEEIGYPTSCAVCSTFICMAFVETGKSKEALLKAVSATYDTVQQKEEVNNEVNERRARRDD